MSALGGRQTFYVSQPIMTHSGPSPKLVGTSMNGSKRSFAMPQSSATEQMRSAPPGLWPAPPSDLVVTASDQRVDAVATATVTMTDAVPTATVTMRVRSIPPHHLH